MGNVLLVSALSPGPLRGAEGGACAPPAVRP